MNFGIEIAVGDPAEPEEWGTVVGDRTIESLIGASLGLGDATCALIVCTDGTYIVGVGEPLRPYDELYVGTDNAEASEVWLNWINQFRE